MVSELYVKLFGLEALESLEKDIRKEFGNQGVDAINKSELSLKVKRHDLPNITWTKDDLKERGEEENHICGKEYTLSYNLGGVYGVGANGIVHTNIREYPKRVEHIVDIILGPRKKMTFRIEI
ncbi:MAG: hypothetical protein KJ949_00525 [Nanoarchaeota archaeon]|nr:hypothetical protein [Nanoarchaeota archaeon]